ncbi:hypothetical protein CBR_g12626 [Chara braunii]|uniref:Reverse transcriptase RNase H-like domain-containing protein n=1 Tax=Chara braunii TaxID=69332 RepID=A0A388KS90_CHABU|nr:hypothetical protein CBR_g12626 [Chara braunii]|eukprot:GBG72906.1 hypothetical protein CBR_g12626 [Chara braunii]
MDGDIYDKFGQYIDPKTPGGVRQEAQRRAAAGSAPPAMFRMWQEREDSAVRVEEIVGENEEVTQRLKAGTIKEEPIVVESDDEELGEEGESTVTILEKMEDLLGKVDRYQQKLKSLCDETQEWKVNLLGVFLYESGPESSSGQQGYPRVATVGPGPRSGMTYRPPTSHGRVPQAARTRSQNKAGTSQVPSQAPSQAPPRREPESERRKEVVEVPEEEEEDDEEEDERLRQEEDRRAELKARKRGVQEEAEPSQPDSVPKRKKCAVRLEEGFDVERMVDRLLEGHNDLMNLKDIFASAPRLRDGLKGRLSRRLVPNVHLSTILSREVEWTEAGTRMDWKCVACGQVDLVVRDHKCTEMVDTGAEMNIIREREAIMLGMEVDRSNHEDNKIVEWPIPFRSITNVRSFLNTCGFWRSFVKNFAAKTEHLRKLVRQDQGWVWGGDQEEAVKRMKEEFKEGGLVLGAPNYEVTEEKSFIIETDAGPTALGGVLVQADAEGKERPLKFESRTLNTTERNYSQFKKETLAVLHCLRIFRNYVYGRRFILRVDPTALACSLKNYTPSNPTVARWLTYIWMFNFELERIPGDKNTADGLSRINWDGPNQDHPIWLAPRGYEQKTELLLKPFQEEDPWGSKDVHWMMKLALAGTHNLAEEVRTIEEGPTQVEEHEQLMGGIYLLTSTLLQGDFDRKDSLCPIEGEDLVPESRDDEFEKGEIKEAFRAEEYDGIYLELGLLLSCEMRNRDASAKAQKMRHLNVARDGHLFIKRQVGNPKRIVCGRNR